MNDRGNAVLWHTERGYMEIGFFMSVRDGVVLEIADHARANRYYTYDEFYLDPQTGKMMVQAIQNVLNGGSAISGTYDLPKNKIGKVYKQWDQFLFGVITEEGLFMGILLRREELVNLVDHWLIPLWR